MATQETDAPPAQQGAIHANPDTKPLLGSAPTTDRGSVQRIAWVVFFVVVFGGIALAIAMGLTGAMGSAG